MTFWAEVAHIAAKEAPVVADLLMGKYGDAIGNVLGQIFGSGSEPVALANAMKDHPQAINILQSLNAAFGAATQSVSNNQANVSQQQN